MQRGEKGPDVGRRRFELLALGVLPVHLGTPLILLSDRGLVEGPQVGKELGGALRRAQLQRDDLGQHLLHQAAFDRVVVEEHERIEPEVQFTRERAQVGRLQLPVDPMGHDMAERQMHVRALLENAKHIGFSVLARETDEHALALGLDREVLHRHETGVQTDSGHAILADHAAPDRVVTVEHQHLVRGGPAHVNLACDDDGQCAEPVVGERDVGELVGDRVVARRRA